VGGLGVDGVVGDRLAAVVADQVDLDRLAAGVPAGSGSYLDPPGNARSLGTAPTGRASSKSTGPASPRFEIRHQVTARPRHPSRTTPRRSATR
jgi:hypothetical protein